MTTQQTRLTSLTPWIVGTVATAIVAVGSVLGFRLFTGHTPANAEAAASSQSAQSDAYTQSDNAPQSATPTPVSIPKPTPPPNLYAGGKEGVEATAQRFLDLWAYAFNTGDTEELMQLCQDGDFCDRFAEDMQVFHEHEVVIKPLEYTYLATDEVYPCYKRSDNTVGICIFLSMSEKHAISLPARSGESPHEYSTVRSKESDGTQEEENLTLGLFLSEQDDHSFIIVEIVLRKPDNA